MYIFVSHSLDNKDHEDRERFPKLLKDMDKKIL